MIFVQAIVFAGYSPALKACQEASPLPWLSMKMIGRRRAATAAPGLAPRACRPNRRPYRLTRGNRHFQVGWVNLVIEPGTQAAASSSLASRLQNVRAQLRHSRSAVVLVGADWYFVGDAVAVRQP